MLTPFTFHDIQRRMGDTSTSTKSPSTFQSGALKTFQSKAREIFQASTENYEKLATAESSHFKSSNVTSLPTLSDFDATKVLPLAESFSTFDPQKTPLQPFQGSKVPTYSSEVSKDLLEATETLPNLFDASKTSPNPFEASLNDPSSFVSSLTSLHLHLSEQRWNF